ncbi:MAG: FAD-binding oxidoreductase [Candidatus Saccharimonadales bacterium]|jgi:FAD/FMN-containing dehydrogenase
MNYEEQLKGIIQGDIITDDAALETASHDASLFELKPAVVVAPKDAADIGALVRFVAKNKPSQPDLSLTVRSAGTDMSGGAINSSIIIDVKPYLHNIFEMSSTSAHLQPGVYYRDFDEKTKTLGAMLPSYPASRDLCTVGGMVANNSGGEKSLQYGKTADYVTELNVIFADGNEYLVKPLQKAELIRVMSRNDFEGKLYKSIFELCEQHYDEIKAAKPQVTKDSTGYHLWDVWDRETGIFDLGKLIIGSQGTLGIVTDITVRLVERPKHSGVLVCFMKDVDILGDVINTVLAHKPATFESFDDNTLWLSFKFFFSFIKKLGLGLWIKTALQLIPDLLALGRGLPKLILMIEFTGNSVEEVEEQIISMQNDLKQYHMLYMERDETEAKANKFWLMRRESFNLLRQKVKDKHTAPFIDDLVIPPPRLPEAWPQLRRILKKYGLLATIAGHMGDGNFHIIPLMNIELEKERAKFKPAMTEVNELVLKMGGSLSGEHNDGMIRGPWLERMYGATVFGYMKQVKAIFDPENIFNPHKKTDASWDYSFSHIRKNF